MRSFFRQLTQMAQASFFHLQALRIEVGTGRYVDRQLLNLRRAL